MTAPIASAQEPEQERLALRGIKGLRVEVEKLHETSTAAGLDAARIKNDIELQLRRRRVPVQPSTPVSEAPYLYLRVTTRKGAGYTFVIELLLRDHVRLVRDSTISTRATTWARMRGGYLEDASAKDKELASAVSEGINAMVDRFADDFIAANVRR